MKWISPVGWCVAFGCRVDAEGGVDGPDWGGVSPHPVVAEMVAAYLELADAEAPTLVEGLYLVGSAVLNDFRPGASDVDFVAVTAAPLMPPGSPCFGASTAGYAAAGVGRSSTVPTSRGPTWRVTRPS